MNTYDRWTLDFPFAFPVLSQPGVGHLQHKF